MKCAHLQLCIWNAAGEPDPSNLSSNDHGWFKDDVVKSLSPVLLTPNVATAPPEILKVICCGCSTEHPCSTVWFVCVTACTVFCSCHVDEKCNNQWTKHVANDTEDVNIDKEVDNETEMPEL